jgi:preprotein translocase SecE subunit
MIAASRQFIQEAFGELRKSTWLSRQQAIGSTITVVVLVCIVAVYVALVDFVLSIFVGTLLGR